MPCDIPRDPRAEIPGHLHGPLRVREVSLTGFTRSRLRSPTSATRTTREHALAAHRSSPASGSVSFRSLGVAAGPTLASRAPAANLARHALAGTMRSACGAAASHEPRAPACADVCDPRAGRFRERTSPGATTLSRRRKALLDIDPSTPSSPPCRHPSLECSGRAHHGQDLVSPIPREGHLAFGDRGCFPPYVSGWDSSRSGDARVVPSGSSITRPFRALLSRTSAFFAHLPIAQL